MNFRASYPYHGLAEKMRCTTTTSTTRITAVLSQLMARSKSFSLTPA